MKDKKEINPFRGKEGNPTVNFAILWDKLHETELRVRENHTDIKWLKREYAIQIGFSITMFLSIILLLCKELGLI